MSGTTPARVAEWTALQDKYKAAHDVVRALEIRLAVRYGSTVAALAYAAPKTRHRMEVLRRAEQRAYARIFRWLSRYSPWDWGSGTSAHWICSSLTADQAMSEAAPILPAESASYGAPQAPHSPERKVAA